MAFFGRDNHEDLNYIEDPPTNPRQVNSTSFLLDVSPDSTAGHSHSSPGVLTHTTPTEMPRPDHSLDHIVDLFDDVQKIFERYPPFDVSALSAGSELLASEHVTSRDGERVIPVKDSAVYTEDDFSSHRSNSFPHIHHPLRPLRSKSHKNVRHGDHQKKKKKKKKRRMHVNKSFPSKSALQSPPIPEDDEEYYSSFDSESDSSSNSRRNSQDVMDGPLLITEMGDLDPSSGVDLERILGDIPPEPSTTSSNSSQLEVTRSTTPERKSFGRKVADFFIGENESSPPREVSSTPSVENAPFDFMADKTSSSLEEQFHLSDIGNTEQEPLLSEQAQYRVGSSRSILDENKSRVHFSVGGDDSTVNLLNIGKEESAPSIPSLNKHSRTSLASEGSGKSGKSHRHKRHHHDHYKTEDLLLRRQKGSEVHLDIMKSEPTEVDEAKMLHKVDLDEMASHRLDNLHGMRRHRLTKNHSAMSSIVHIGKHKKTKHKIFQPRKKFDHRPHEMFVELDELYEGEGENYEWREKARWIKFEEDVEEGAERWGKPHVASLSFHSLLELRRGLENGTLILDLEAEDLPSIVNYVVNDMVIHDHIKSEHKGKVLKTLLMKHKHVGDKMKTLIRRNISYMNLSGLDSSSKTRHQKEKSSIRRSITSTSFRSSTSLEKMAETPSDTAIKKEKEALQNAKNNEVKNLEFVKVDVDNNMHADGVHIGITTNESRQKNIQDIMRRIPKDAEALTVLVGCVDYLAKPAMAFVRLAEGQVLDNLTEVPLPVRFLFVLLGPENAMDYHEVGRSISTLMANQHFHDIAYKAISRDELLHAINEFLDESIVLPPGDWDQKTLLPIMDMARKKARAMRRKKHKEEEKIALLKKEEEDKIPLDPIKRTGRLFGGLINDIKRRYPHYWSDFKDALHFQCVASFIFIFFACLSPTIAFGGLLGEKTNKYMGVTETIISTSLSGVLFGLFSAQPLMILGATGPVLVFEESLYQFCDSYDIEFLPMRFWIGFWVMLITFVVIGLEGSYLVKHITRFTEEIFTIVISLIFIYEVVKKIKATFIDHPLLESYTDCNANTFNISSNISTNDTAPYQTVTPTEHLYSHEQEPHAYHDDTPKPNTSLLSLVLMLGTFFIAYFLRIFRNSKFLGRSARRALGDFGVVIALFLMVLLDAITPTVYTQKLLISDDFTPTDSSKRGWFVPPMGIKQPMKTDMIIGASLPAFLLFILLFLETQITEMTLNKKEFKMKKGSGYHIDQVLLGIITFIGGLFGLPWMCAATVRTLCHVSSLSVYSRFHAPGEKPKLVKIREQRVTNIAVNLLLGLSLLWGPLLRLVPMAVLFGIFLYVGVSALSGLQLYRRIKLLFIPNKYHPSTGYVRRVRTSKMHLFTIIQVLLLALMFGLKLSPAAIAFPLFIILLIPVRLKVMAYFFSNQELNELDKEDEDSDFEDEDDRDFYQLAHMPI